MLRLFSDASLNLFKSCTYARNISSSASVLAKPLESFCTPIVGNNLFNRDKAGSKASDFNGSRSLSKYVLRFEKRKRMRGIKPKDETAHMPDYMVENMPNQEDNKEARNITSDIIDKVNTQILERTHGRLFAVVQLTGKQFKITPEDIIIVQGYWAPTVGDRIRLEKVLLAGSSDFTLLGRPMLPPDLVRIEASVIEKTLSYTKLHFVLIKRKNFRRTHFYKTPYTMLRINSIEFDGLVNKRKEIEGQRNVIY